VEYEGDHEPRLWPDQDSRINHLRRGLGFGERTDSLAGVVTLGTIGRMALFHFHRWCKH
jgi:hypothetical protein